jgi:hypothetical protein
MIAPSFKQEKLGAEKRHGWRDVWLERAANRLEFKNALIYSFVICAFISSFPIQISIKPDI